MTSDIIGGGAERDPTTFESIPGFGQKAIEDFVSRGLEFTDPSQQDLFAPQALGEFSQAGIAGLGNLPTDFGLGQDFGLGNLQAQAGQLPGVPGAQNVFSPQFDFGQRASDAFGGVESLIGSAQGFAQGGLAAAEQGITPEAIQSFINPFTQQVIDPAVRNIQEAAAEQGADISGLASNLGAFGGTRQALLESRLGGETQRAIGDVTGQLRSRAFDVGLGAAQQDIQNRLQAAGLGAQTALGGAGQQRGLGTDLFGARQGVQAIQSQQRADQLAQQQAAQRAAIQGIELQSGLTGQQANLTGQQAQLAQQGALGQLQAGDILRQQAAGIQQAPLSQLEFNRNLLGIITGISGGGDFSTAGFGDPLSNIGRIAGAAAPLIAASRKKFKTNIKLVGKENGFNIYEFNYKPIMMIEGRYLGVMAEEVEHIPNAIVANDLVDYGVLGIEFRRIT